MMLADAAYLRVSWEPSGWVEHCESTKWKSKFGESRKWYWTNNVVIVSCVNCDDECVPDNNRDWLIGLKKGWGAHACCLSASTAMVTISFSNWLRAGSQFRNVCRLSDMRLTLLTVIKVNYGPSRLCESKWGGVSHLLCVWFVLIACIDDFRDVRERLWNDNLGGSSSDGGGGGGDILDLRARQTKRRWFSNLCAREVELPAPRARIATSTHFWMAIQFAPRGWTLNIVSNGLLATMWPERATNFRI